MTGFPLLADFSENDVAAFRASGGFDEHWYLSEYPDVARSGIDPARHYLWIGRKLGRLPLPRRAFKASDYVAPLTERPREQGNERQFSKRRFYDPPAYQAAKVIAFYLPQFHTFAKNDEWWGEGFTEWTNVRPAVPQFHGHYQPHIPHTDVGYYDLSDNNVFRKQIDIAKSHGVSGFCYYYYWFAGERLMERALESFLSDKSLDFPFCVCWANENWTRRWDGLESEILIAQGHSPEDDIACIEDLSRFFRDERYIKVDGKPLMVIYRPSLLPNAKETADRWRDWCRRNGIGEIYLAYTQSFERVDPTEYGFDAAIEFPPNNSGPADLTSSVIPLSEDFEAKVYDWVSLAKRSEIYDNPSYKLFRSVCPGWDNTARRKNKGSILINNSPDYYEKWLKNAIRETILRSEGEGDRLVFVNAWNEWAEGAHLEPDMQDGYSYLEATRRAVNLRTEAPKIAVAIHAFYPDVLQEIIRLTEFLPKHVQLFVTTPKDKRGEVEAILARQSLQYQLLVTENRGRDVLPFLQVLDILVEQGFEYVLKVHTKKSLHRDDGDSWRNDLYEAVLGISNFLRSIVAFQNDANLGILGPRGHLVSMDTYLGSNLDRILQYSRLLGIGPDEILDHAFFAGTMFIARVAALEPILHLGISEQDFEPESGQIDGTLAHAVERLIGLSACSRKYRLGFTCDPFEEALINRTYGFA